MEPKSVFDERVTGGATQIKKPKNDSSLRDIISATESEVYKLLEEVIKRNETPIESEICLRLKELIDRMHFEVGRYSRFISRCVKRVEMEC